VADSRIEELRRRIERDPGSRLFAQLAEQLRKDGELEEAIRIARGGLEKHPNYPSARLTLGHALLDAGDPAAARDELDRAFKGAPDNILASRLLGEALETLGDLEAALSQFRKTLAMAPTDRHVQARVQSIQERLGAPAAEKGSSPGDGGGAAARGAAASPTPRATGDLTKPTPAVERQEAPQKEPGPEPGPAEGAEPGLPPTIRIRMPGDPVGGIPPPKPLARPPAGATPPRDAASAPTGESAAAETTLPDRRHVTDGVLPATLPGGGTPSRGVRAAPGPPRETTPGVEGGGGPPRAPAPEGEPDGSRQADGARVEGDSDLAPTLPTSKAAEYAAMGESLPPTVPPGLVTAPDGVRTQAGPTEPTASTRAEKPPAVVHEATPPIPEPAAAESKHEPGPAAPVPQPRVVEPLPEPSPTQPRPEGRPAGTGPEPRPRGAEAPHAPGGRAPRTEATGKPLSSGTLAELYFQQGSLERAVEVYREVLTAEPGNEAARARLAEIEAEVAAGKDEAAPVADDGEGRAARRRVLERTIERLEALLAVVQGR
jgi:cytochrome c-type biogenesis protein CcmH/NrfG